LTFLRHREHFQSVSPALLDLLALDAGEFRQMFFGPAILDELERIILAQWMPFPIRRQQNAPQVWMIVKDDTEEIVDLTLQPISDRPDAGHAFNPLILRVDFQTHTLVFRNRIQVVNDFERRYAIVRVMD